MGHIFNAGGALTSECISYIRRKADGDVQRFTEARKYAYVIAPRQTGKTSLLKRLAQELRQQQWRCGYVDLSTLKGMEESVWYKKLGQLLAPKLTPSKRPTLADQIDFREYLLDEALQLANRPQHIALLLDEIGTVAELPFSDSFFMTLRALYNERDDYSGDLVVVMAGTVDPGELVKDDKISPFNISQPIQLDDFTSTQSRELTNYLTKLDLPVDDLVHHHIYEWTSGQPYLTQRLCATLESWVHEGHIIKITPAEIDRVVEEVIFNPIIRNSNLTHITNELAALSQAGTAAWQTIMTGHRLLTSSMGFYELYLTGVVKTDASGSVIIRNRIYQQIFIFRNTNNFHNHSTSSTSEPKEKSSSKAQNSLNVGEVRGHEVVIGTKIVYTQPSDDEARSNSQQSPNQMLSFPERTELVQHLLVIPSIAGRGTRTTVIDQLRSEIKTNVVYNSVDKIHVFNIVNTCLQYPNGMQDLRDILQFFEGDSIPMQRFKETLNRLLSRG